MRIKIFLLLVTLPFIGNAQSYEVGVGAGVSINSKPTQNEYYRGDVITPNYATNLTLLANLHSNWQVGIDVHALELSRKSSSDVPQLYTDYSGGDGKKFIYGRITSSLCAAVNKKINTSTGYFYVGAEAGLAMERDANSRYPSGNVYYIAPDGGYGFVYGPHAGYTWNLTKKIALNAEVAALFYDFYNSAAAAFSEPNTNLHYQIAAYPLTVGVRYKFDNLKANKNTQPDNIDVPVSMIMHNGYVTTNSRGFAVVKLPANFDAVFKVFHYQLSVVGDIAQATVFKEVKGNSFEIKTDKPNVKVNWSIISVMKDAAANTNSSLYGGERVQFVNLDNPDQNAKNTEDNELRQQRNEDSLNDATQKLKIAALQQTVAGQENQGNGIVGTQQPQNSTANNAYQDNRVGNNTSKAQQAYTATNNSSLYQKETQNKENEDLKKKIQDAEEKMEAGQDKYATTTHRPVVNYDYVPAPQASAAKTTPLLIKDISTSILFDPGKSNILQSSLPVLEEAVKEMSNNKNAFIIIDGYTDNIGSPDSNITLSFQRADKVKMYLMDRGVDPKKIIKVGHGETAPLYTNATPEGRAHNRRVTITIKDRSRSSGYKTVRVPASNQDKHSPQGNAAQPIPLDFEDISTPILFEAGKAIIRESSLPVLEEALMKMSENKNAFIIVDGYTDNIGAPDSTMVHSFKLANAVKMYLTEKGIDPKRILSVGHSDNSPISIKTEGRASYNRAAIITIKNRGR